MGKTNHRETFLKMLEVKEQMIALNSRVDEIKKQVEQRGLAKEVKDSLLREWESIVKQMNIVGIEYKVWEMLEKLS